jgi:hypothetical protein
VGIWGGLKPGIGTVHNIMLCTEGQPLAYTKLQDLRKLRARNKVSVRTWPLSNQVYSVEGADAVI